MFRNIVLLAGGLASLSAVSAFAQEAVLGQEYGAGVHAYFTGDYVKAHEHLTVAIHGGSKDPRAFYFRGLSCLMLGRPQDATIDFRDGAKLESADVNRYYDVGKALERVQGQARIELENYRVAARMAALEEAERVRKSRYEAIHREESRVLREQAQGAPPPGEEPAPTDASGEEEENPFASPGDAPVKKRPKPTKKPAAKAADDEEEEENPFGEEAAKPEKPEAKKPEAKKPEAKKPEAKKPEAKKKADDDDPFGNEAPKDDKPGEKKPDDKGKKGTDDKKDGKKKPAEKKTDPNDPFA